MPRIAHWLFLTALFCAPLPSQAQVLIPNEPADAQPPRVNSQDVKVSV
ncbi:MAG: hypothetical protein ACO1SX_00170 [Actinomycetota bacterium]